MFLSVLPITMPLKSFLEQALKKLVGIDIFFDKRKLAVSQIFLKNQKFKVPLKSILKMVSKHATKTVNYVVVNCRVRSLNSFTPFPNSGFLGRPKTVTR